MASNDMNSWDEDPDELLRRRWQQTFADFSVRPSASTSKLVFDSLKRTRRRRRVLRRVMMTTLLMLITGVVYQAGPDEPVRPAYRSDTTTRSTGSAQLPPARQIRLRVVPGQLAVSRNASVTAPAVGTLPRQQARPATSQPSTFTTKRPSTYVHPSGHDGPRVPHRPHAHPLLEAARHTVRLSRRQPDLFVDPRVSDSSPSHVEPATDRAASSSSGQSIGTSGNTIPTPSKPTMSFWPTSSQPVHWNTLRSRALSYLPTSFGLAMSQGRVLLPESVLSRTLQAAVDHSPSRPRWYVEALPLSSFQWMSAPLTSAAYLSQVSAPAPFSLATWGYQLNGGIRFRSWQVYLATGQLRRWASYTVSENRYRIDPNVNNANGLVRITHSVAENVSLPMVGIGVSQYRLFSQNRYMVTIGGQVSYLPTSHQSLTGLRAGLGRQIPLRPHLAAQIGLTVEYGLNRLLDERQQLVIRPLVVGLGVQIQSPFVR